jgi:peroxiredoxin
VLRGHSGQAERAIFVVDKKGMIAYVDIHDIAEQPPTDTIIAALDKLR